MSDYLSEYKRWLELGSPDECRELGKLTQNEIKERFYTELEFGTAGMRRLRSEGSSNFLRFPL